MVVLALRSWGHQVYDVRNPPGGTSFEWSSVDPGWRDWSAVDCRDGLLHPVAQAGFRGDLDGMTWADVGILLLPSGRSAHLELGWMAGQGKKTIIWTSDGQEPELMALLATSICVNADEVRQVLASWQ